MRHIILRAGGRVALVGHDGAECDVTCRSEEYLFHNAVLVDDLKLRDIFVLLHENPTLIKVFRQHFAEPLLNEALSGPPPSHPAPGPNEIEYLELSRYCFVDELTHTYDSTQFLMLLGVGFALPEPLQTDHQTLPAGHRQRWNISLVPARELSIFPLRFSEEVEVGNRSRLTGEREESAWTSGKVKFGPPTLGQVIHGVLHELSYFGVGEARDEFQSMIVKATGQSMT